VAVVAHWVVILESPYMKIVLEKVLQNTLPTATTATQPLV